MTMKHTRIDIETEKRQTEEFRINKEVEQGDALLASFFNIALEYILQKVSKRILRTKTSQIIAFADNLVLIAKVRDIIETMVNKLSPEGLLI